MADQEKAQMQDLAKEIQRSIAGGVFDIDFSHLTARRQETVRLATRQILRVLKLNASAPVCPDCGEVMKKRQETHADEVDGDMEWVYWSCGCKPEADQEVSEFRSDLGRGQERAIDRSAVPEEEEPTGDETSE